MKIVLASILSKRTASGPANELVEMYIERCGRFCPTEARVFPSEARLLAYVEENTARTKPGLALMDSRGKQLSSEELAGEVKKQQESGVQLLIFAIGPADGWSPEALKRATLTVAFGRITLPHQLAAAVTAEQIYRALTILAGHPYHAGH